MSGAPFLPQAQRKAAAMALHVHRDGVLPALVSAYQLQEAMEDLLRMRNAHKPPSREWKALFHGHWHVREELDKEVLRLRDLGALLHLHLGHARAPERRAA